MSKLNTNSNAYIIIYSAVLVVIVAFLLAFVYQALKPMQDANVELDKEKQILSSLNIRGLDDVEADATYHRLLTKVDSVGQGKERKPYIYYFKVDGNQKYVFPLKGMGLWGGISGFVSLNDDKNTVYGAYFDHESETAGLGAEIKDSQEWQEKFQGKKVFDEAGQIAIGVEKKVEDGKKAYEVDAVTGATLTSNGVRDMLRSGFKQYEKFLKEE